jgi:hypothetical protein
MGSLVLFNELESELNLNDQPIFCESSLKEKGFKKKRKDFMIFQKLEKKKRSQKIKRKYLMIFKTLRKVK